MRNTIISFAAFILAAILSGCAGSVDYISLDSYNSPKSYYVPPNGPERIRAILKFPEGEGPFPAVVILHTCAGIKDNDKAWEGRFLSWGYATIMPDSFGPRGFSNVCGTTKVTSSDRARDAYGALLYLRTHPKIDPNRIGVFGESHGGGGLLEALDETSETLVPPSGERFGAGVAIYPYCGWQTEIEPNADLLILVGDKDDWTPANLCENMVEQIEKLETPFKTELKIYKGATHSFDINRSPIIYQGHSMRFSPVATEDAIARTKRFFEENL